MRVIHIIPSAFDYFNDIRARAFGWTEALQKIGIEIDVCTLQYGVITPADKAEVAATAPTRNYLGTVPVNQLLDNLSNYDLVHLHCPFLGAARRIFNWKRLHPDTPLVLTYHRDVDVSDLICLFIRWYNNYHLPRLFSLANPITCLDRGQFNQSLGRKFLSNQAKLIVLDEDEEKQVKSEDSYLIIENLFLIYNVLIAKQYE